ncbi:Uncharacterized protein HZ326_28635 [Fusarium oxysporum f. sp. albedinis]|nr:Uncharacterized protein HZ326_28635 [Fusarium oxysporum f. sp. albedinis]
MLYFWGSISSVRSIIQARSQNIGACKTSVAALKTERPESPGTRFAGASVVLFCWAVCVASGLRLKRNSLIGSRDMRETRPRIQDSIQRSAFYIMSAAQRGLITASTVMYMPPDANAIV